VADDLENLRRELDYYRRQLDELTGENIRLDYVSSGLRHEILQKRAGFAVLSELQQKIGAHKQISSIFELVVPAVNASVAMERTVVLTPTAEEHTFRPAHWLGYAAEDAAKLASASLDVPPELLSRDAALIVNKSTPPTPFIERARAALMLPHFVMVTVAGERAPIGLLVSGRVQENPPLFPPLDQGDLDTFQAIAGLISASVRNMRVAVLEESDRLKSEFFANISHEFRTPITLTLGPIEQLLSGRCGELPAEARERLLMMQRNQERLLNLVNQILDLTRLEAGAARLEATHVPDVNRLIERRLAQFQPVAEPRGLQLRLRTDPAADGVDLYIDREKFDKVLANLLSNALKFTRAGFIEVTTRVRDSSLWLEVTDSGIGIKADQLPHIFDRFRQADGSESRDYAGSGIGLALVKEVAALHGGEVHALSEYGRGSTFRVRIPLGRSHLDPSCVLQGGEEHEAQPMREFAVLAEGRADQEGADKLNHEAEAEFDAERPTLLYAEDNADLRLHVRDVLRPGMNVFVAVDGADALRLARQYRPDVVLADQMMPRMSGRDLLRAIRADAELRETPVIILTARVGTEARIESLDSGADDYLTKPFHEGELRARVTNLIRARRQSRQVGDLNRRLEARVQEQMAELVRAGELLRFLPRAVAERVIQGQAQDETLQRLRITVLSAALDGLPALMEALEPEELSTVVNELLREIIAVAMEEGGTVTHTGADSLTVLFGAPAAMEPVLQAAAAVRAALRMRESLPRLRTMWRRRGIVEDVHLRMGINTGFSTVGMFGSEHLRSYTAVGPSVVAASRLQATAAPDEILCGAPTFVLLEPHVRGESRGLLPAQGGLRPMEMFSVTALDRAAIEQPEPAAPKGSDGALAGSSLGRYRIVSRLGAGGMGEVYRAHDPRLQRDVALKVLSALAAGEEQALRRFEREARAVAALNHPNIVVIYSFEQADGTAFITMELLEGQSLDRVVPAVGLDLATLKQLAVPIADALASAHGSGITHRDLKPSNVMLTRERRVKVLDFGLAKRVRDDATEPLLARSETMTRHGVILGTLAYSAPEVAQGREADHRSDLFSLGVMLYEMATGVRPFTGASPTEVLASILRDDPPPLAVRRPDLPAAFSRVVRRCLEKDPAKRYADTRDLLRDLQMLASSAAETPR
jgi:signal transduction histidine kinase/DNA-binding response OmpR family regulator